MVCANSLKEARAIATLEPDIILCELTELIEPEIPVMFYVTSTTEAIKAISPKTLVMQAEVSQAPRTSSMSSSWGQMGQAAPADHQCGRSQADASGYGRCGC